GEPIPTNKASDDPVFAGTVNQAALLNIRAEGVGADTTLARIVRRVEQAQEAKAPTQRFIEHFANWYTPAIIGLSVVAFLISWNIELALTLLVIGCPGALVISTPVSVVAGIGRAAKSGILIKGGEHLERAGKIRTVALDKTGTITEGRPKLTDVIALQPTAVAVTAGSKPLPSSMENPEDEVVYWAATAEGGSEHPLARPILDSARERGIDVAEAESFETQTGRGIRVHDGGHEIVVGSRAWLSDLNIPVTEDADASLAQLKAEGKTAVLVALDDEVIGVLGVADEIREMAPAMIHWLHEAGVERVVMLTGDDERTAWAIATEAGIDDVRADLLPEEKQHAIRGLQDEGDVVAMVGDGINDAPAMAQADIGIAMGAAGTDVAIETADIALMADNLGKIPEAIALSKRLLHNIRQNVGIALLTVLALLAGVLVGEVRMAGGMFVHEASVLIVILNGMRLMRA
ncbi:MAG: heavy metal translocating P-type ATPase, partial [Candidatus Bipolaricaulia bacterium]